VSKLQLSLACAGYDRTRALFDGRVSIDGVDIVPTILEPEEAFHRAFKYGEFDITEISMSSHTVMTARGEAQYVGIPAFLSRVFRHSGIYINTSKGIRRPEDLKGKTIGVPEYQITANVWIRGILSDDYGVRADQVHWRRGGIEQPGRGERSPIKLPDSIDLQQIPDDKTLSGMLESGEIDAMISARAPSCLLRGSPNVARLFPNFKEVEAEYFKRSRHFPIMHMVGIRKSLVEQHPWLPVNVYKAFAEAKRLAMHDLNEINMLLVTLPWVVHEYNATRELMGDDYWPYGFKENLHSLEVFTRYHHEQGLSSRKLNPEELFTPSVIDLSRI
jgi:4,5-dihydroxyphthalate decarboxylase